MSKCNNKILFDIIRGDDKAFKFNIKNAKTNTPYDVTGWELTMSLKKNKHDLTDKGIVIKMPKQLAPLSSEDIGVAYIVLNKSITKDLLPIPYYFDVQRDFNGITTTLLIGRLRVLADITRNV